MATEPEVIGCGLFGCMIMMVAITFFLILAAAGVGVLLRVISWAIGPWLG